MAGRTSPKSGEDEPGVLFSQTFLEGENAGPLSQQLQATSCRGSEPLSNLDVSQGPLVNLEYLPFFRTYGQLLGEESALQPQVCRDPGGDWGVEAPFWEDPEPPGGLFPYYRSKEESFPSLSCRGSQDSHSRGEEQAGCFCRTGSSRSSAAPAGPDLVSGSSPACCPILLVSAGHSHDSGLDTPFSSDAAFSGHALCDSRFVPYNRTPEEWLHTSPGPAASPLGGQEPTGELPKPGAARATTASPQHLLIVEGKVAGEKLSLPWDQSLQAFPPLPQCPQPAELAGGAQSLAGSPISSQSIAEQQGDPVLVGVWLSRPAVCASPRGTEESSSACPCVQPHSPGSDPTTLGCFHLALLAGKPAQ